MKRGAWVEGRGEEGWVEGRGGYRVGVKRGE